MDLYAYSAHFRAQKGSRNRAVGVKKIPLTVAGTGAGVANAGEGQYLKLQTAIHSIAKELSAVNF